MSDCFKDIFIGEVIRRKVDEKGIPYAEFARRINCARTSLYHIFNSKSIDVERLLLIATVLEYDFIGEIYSYKTKPMQVEMPFLQLPLKNGIVDFSHLPKEFLHNLKHQIEDSLSSV